MSMEKKTITYSVRVEWDTEEDGVTYDPQEIGLPEVTTVDIPHNYEYFYGDLEEALADTLSNTYGYCVLDLHILD